VEAEDDDADVLGTYEARDLQLRGGEDRRAMDLVQVEAADVEDSDNGGGEWGGIRGWA
jgi:hypothetical protein